jgi:hypothetical protein
MLYILRFCCLFSLQLPGAAAGLLDCWMADADDLSSAGAAGRGAMVVLVLHSMTLCRVQDALTNMACDI